MGITIKQKKLFFIILSSALLIFIFVFGMNTYYQENKGGDNQPVIYKMMESAKLASESCIRDELENEYRICCSIQEGIKKGLAYDCSLQEYFEPGQNVYIIFNPSKLDIPYSPYYLYVYSDLNTEKGEPIMSLYEVSALDKKEDSIIRIVGTMPEETESFILLEAIIYSSSTFDEKDKQVVFYREAKVSK